MNNPFINFINIYFFKFSTSFNNIALVFIFLFEDLFSSGAFSIILYASGLGLAALNVSKIETPKLSGKPINVVLLAAYTLLMTAIYGWKLL